DGPRGLANPEPARREENRKEAAQAEELDPVDVQLLALVVQRREPRAARPRQRPHDGNALGPCDALREHEALEFLAAEAASLAEHRHVQILVERDLTGLQRADELGVPVLKILGIEAEALHCLCP